MERQRSGKVGVSLPRTPLMRRKVTGKGKRAWIVPYAAGPNEITLRSQQPARTTPATRAIEQDMRVARVTCQVGVFERKHRR